MHDHPTLPGFEFSDSYHPSIIVIPHHTRINFWKKVVKTSGCWFFTGAISSPDGYGRITFRFNGITRTLSAHRFAILAAGRHILPHEIIEHRCNEPLCVRIDDDHVRISTQSANLRYAISCGRYQGRRCVVNSHRRAERSRAIREHVRAGFNADEYHTIITSFESSQSHIPHPTLW